MADGFPAIAFLLQHLTPFKVSCVKISVLLLNRRFFITPAFGRFTVLVGKLCASLGSLRAFLARFPLLAGDCCLGPQLISPSKCRDVQAVWYGVPILKMVLDVVVLCMPLSAMWRFPLSWRKKLG